MSIVIVGLLLLLALLGVAALAVPLARWLHQPVAVLFAALGLTYGLVTSVLGGEVHSGVLDSYDQWFVQQLALNSQSMLYLFLPPLLFEMMLSVNVRRLAEDTALVVVMAVLAVATATALVGVALWAATPIAFVACLLLGSAVATTDPGAVISTFRELGAPRRLLVILEGESLLNDAAAIAIFGLLLGVMRHEITPSFLRILYDFLYSFGTGAGVGLLIAAVAGQIYPLLSRSSAAEASVTVIVAYGSFIAAEQVFGGSGVVAVVFAGMMTGWTGFMRMGPGNWQTVRTVWTQIGFWANALIMIIATSLVPGLIGALDWMIVPATLVVYLAAMAARAVILLGVTPALARIRLTAPLTRQQSYLVLWGGVRGSVTLVLALSIADLSALGSDARMLAAIAATYTLLTIFLNASTLAWLTRKLKLNSLSATDMALREKIIAGSLERVRTVVGNIARERHLEPEALAAVEAALGEQKLAVEAEAEAQAAGERIPFGERLRLGLAIAAGQEARLIRRALEDGAIGRRAAAVLRLNADRIADAARMDGREGYAAATMTALRPSKPFRAAVLLRRYLWLDWPLRATIELHFTTLLESERFVRDLVDFVGRSIEPMIGTDAADNLKQVMQHRHVAINGEIEAIATQYPKYSLSVETALVARTAIRRERQQYARLLSDGVIGQELYDDLIAGLEARERRAAQPPKLDLTMTPTALLDRVPVFAALSPQQKRSLAKALRTEFSTPGEQVVKAGERGGTMYFVASGALETVVGDTTVSYGTGDFFGELAFLYPHRRRSADVTSLGFCRLLALRRRAFQKLSARDPAIESIIRAAAAERIATYSPAPVL